MNESEAELRKQIIHYAKRLSADGLSPGKSGNISVRFGNGCLITPSATDYDQLTSDDIVLIDLSGKIIRSMAKPSSEWHFHCGIYLNRSDVQAVVHTHSTYSTALACAHKNIPAFHYMVAVAGGKDIPLVDYALFGTTELSENVVAGLLERNACLLANHGLVSVAENLEKAFNLTAEVECLAKQYCEVLKLGEPQLLTDAEMALVMNKFNHYGQRT
mgnify:CR=1 FL=1